MTGARDHAAQQGSLSLGTLSGFPEERTSSSQGSYPQLLSEQCPGHRERVPQAQLCVVVGSPVGWGNKAEEGQLRAGRAHGPPL